MPQTPFPERHDRDAIDFIFLIKCEENSLSGACCLHSLFQSQLFARQIFFSQRETDLIHPADLMVLFGDEITFRLIFEIKDFIPLAQELQKNDIFQQAFRKSAAQFSTQERGIRACDKDFFPSILKRSHEAFPLGNILYLIEKLVSAFTKFFMNYSVQFIEITEHKAGGSGVFKIEVKCIQFFHNLPQRLITLRIAI